MRSNAKGEVQANQGRANAQRAQSSITRRLTIMRWQRMTLIRKISCDLKRRRARAEVVGDCGCTGDLQYGRLAGLTNEESYDGHRHGRLRHDHASISNPLCR